jgi:hypothetical protein
MSHCHDGPQITQYHNFLPEITLNMIVIQSQKRNINVANTIYVFASVSPEAASKKAKIIQTLPSAVANETSRKSVRFADTNETYESDKSSEEAVSTWITVSGLLFNNDDG